MGYYGLDHPNPNAPKRGDGQYWGRETRRAAVTGAIAVHSTEGVPDYTSPDYGAENTAKYFTHSTRPASYHTIVDSDSIVEFLPLDHEAYHDATGGNRWAMGLSMGTQAHTWGRNPAHDDAMLRNAGRGIAKMLRYWASLGAGRDPIDGARWITPSQYRSGQPGLVEHGELDPSRRSDPWTAHRLRPALRERLLSYVLDELGHKEDDVLTKEESEALRAIPGAMTAVAKELASLRKEVQGIAVGPGWGHETGVFQRLDTLIEETLKP